MKPDAQPLSKVNLRNFYRRILRALPAKKRERDSVTLCEIISMLDDWRRACVVMLYVAMSDEPDLTPLFLLGVKMGKVCVLPAYIATSDTYCARAVTDLRTQLRRGHLGILEPIASCPIVDPREIDLVLVPGLAFDRRGVRLGRGKGYFDKFLVGLRATKCGVAFNEQVIDTLPADPHDVKMDLLVTPAGVIKFSK